MLGPEIPDILCVFGGGAPYICPLCVCVCVWWWDKFVLVTFVVSTPVHHGPI